MFSLTVCFWRSINNPKWDNFIPSWHTVNFVYMAKLIKQSRLGWFLVDLGLNWHQLLKKKDSARLDILSINTHKFYFKKWLNSFPRAPKPGTIVYTYRFSLNFYFGFLVTHSKCKPYIIFTSAFKPHYCKEKVICDLKWSRREIPKLLAALSLCSFSTSGCGPEQLPQSVCQPRCGTGAARHAPQETCLRHLQQWDRPVPEIPARHTRSVNTYCSVGFFQLTVECLHDRVTTG